MSSLTSCIVGAACLLVGFAWYVWSITKRAKPDPNERPVTDADIGLAKNKATAGLSTPRSAEQIVRECQDGTVSATVTLESFLGRAQACSDITGCVVKSAQPIIEVRAREIARTIDEMPKEKRKELPLCGLPFSVKECYLVKGTDSTLGISSRRGVPQNEDAALVAQMIKLGAVPFCKTNIPQIMYAWECANPVHGVTSHPLHRSFIPGGSTGGEASLIAAGGSVVGLGTDIGGSCRIPCHMSGCCGMKCTKNRLSSKGKGPSVTYGDGQQIIASCPGPIARTCKDLSFMLRTLLSDASLSEMRQTLDIAVVPAPWREANASKPLVIGWYTYDGFLEASPACTRAVREAVKALEQSGATLVEFQPPGVEDAIYTNANLLASGGPHIIKLLTAKGVVVSNAIVGLVTANMLPGAVRKALAKIFRWMGAPVMASMAEAAGQKTAAEYYEHVQAAELYKSKFAKAFDPSLDLLLAPVHVRPTHPHMTSKDITPTVCYSTLYNLLDYPAGTLPVTTVQPGDVWESPMVDKILDPRVRKAYRQTLAADVRFPVGVQLIGRPFQEELVLRGMLQLEAALSRS
jgi:Asp-tRNA(Asn)/Glu-tRNA(Gln) amidotransferase A subunit family amidase